MSKKPIDINWRGRIIKGGCVLWLVGTFDLKSQVYGALRRTLAGPDQDGVPPARRQLLHRLGRGRDTGFTGIDLGGNADAH